MLLQTSPTWETFMLSTTGYQTSLTTLSHITFNLSKNEHSKSKWVFDILCNENIKLRLPVTDQTSVIIGSCFD